MDNEFDNIQDDIADLVGVDWDQIDVQGITSSLPGPGNPDSLFEDFSDDFFDPATLEEIDELERRALTQNHDTIQLRDRTASAAQAGSAVQNEVALSLSDSRTSRYFESICDKCDRTDSPRKKRRSSSADALAPGKRTRMIHSNNEQEGPSAEGLEDELTCPICFDILVATHAANPCGHSFCGSCGEQWTIKNTNDRCPICRTKLTKEMPMIPNIAMDSVIDKYIQILGASGLAEWTKGGEKFEERASRKEAWKQENLKRKNAAAHSQKYPTVALYVSYEDADVSYRNAQHFDEVPPSLQRSPRRRRRNRRHRN